MMQEKVLLNVEETAAYLNLGMTKTRELMKENEKIFVVRIGYKIALTQTEQDNFLTEMEDS